MNTTTTATRLRGLIATAIVSALATSFAVDCAAADSTNAPNVIVKYGDLNVSNPQGAVVLYRRIRTAAETVCPRFDHGDLRSEMQKDACVSKAIAEAVTKVNEPALFAIYNEKSATPLPTPLLSQSR
jgi:UrcA family protein